MNRHNAQQSVPRSFEPFISPNELIEEYLPLLNRFWEVAPYEKSVFIIHQMSNDITMRVIIQAIEEELEKVGLKGRYVTDCARPYSRELYKNNAVYMRGCKYGIAVFERRAVEGEIPHGPNHNVLVELGFVLGRGSEILVLYDEHSMDTKIGNTTPPEGLGLPAVISGRIRESFKSDEGEGLPTLRQVVSKWANSIIEERKKQYVGKTILVIMRFADVHLLNSLFSAIKDELEQMGFKAVRSDDKVQTQELWTNVRKYMHDAIAGIAIFDNVSIAGALPSSFNPNVSIEAGYMLGLGKPVLLLKDKHLSEMPTDFRGMIYSEFNGDQPDSARRIIHKWILDTGIASP